MREIKTIDVDRYEPSDKPGMVKHVGMISPREAFDVLGKHLESEGLMPDEYFNLITYKGNEVKELPDYLCADCNVNWGGNEGIYLDISLLYSDENRQLQRFAFATGKTLGRTGDDFLRMSRIAAECSMMLNGRGDIVRFYEEEREKKGIEVELNNQMTARVNQDKNGDILAELVDTDGEVIRSATIEPQVMFEFLAEKLNKEPLSKQPVDDLIKSADEMKSNKDEFKGRFQEQTR